MTAPEAGPVHSGSTHGTSTVFLHVGAPKTGTTYLQEVLWRNREALASRGVCYPGTGPADHFHAALDLRGVRFLGQDNPRVPGSWERVAQRARQWRGSVVIISHEMLAWATEEQAQRAVRSLQPAEVHVVYTARDLARQIPAVWQESVKNGRVVGFPRFLKSLASPEKPGPWGRLFWGAQDPVDVFRRWGSAVPAERMHVVTVPPPGGPSGVLWERFAGLVGFQAHDYVTDVGSSNVSLGRVEVELLRRVNRAVGEGFDGGRYERLFKRGLAENVLASRDAPVRISLPAQWHTWAVERAEKLVESLRAGGYPVVGDLDDLIPRPPSEDVDPAAESTPRPNEILDVAAETIARLVSEPVPAWRRRGERLARLVRRVKGR